MIDPSVQEMALPMNNFTTKQDMVDQGWNLDIECPDDDVVDEDWLSGVSCNTDNPEECEACQ